VHRRGSGPAEISGHGKIAVLPARQHDVATRMERQGEAATEAVIAGDRDSERSIAVAEKVGDYGGAASEYRDSDGLLVHVDTPVSSEIQRRRGRILRCQAAILRLHRHRRKRLPKSITGRTEALLVAG